MADIEALAQRVEQTSTTVTETPTAADILSAIRKALDLSPIQPVKLPCVECTKLNEHSTGLPLGSVAVCPTCFKRLRAHAAGKEGI